MMRGGCHVLTLLLLLALPAAAQDTGDELSSIHFINDDNSFYKEIANSSLCWAVLLSPSTEHEDDGLQAYSRRHLTMIRRWGSGRARVSPHPPVAEQL